MRKNKTKTLFSSFMLLALLAATACTVGRHFTRPKLVVLIAVDAFRFDYLTRFYDQFSDGGFKLLLARGANFTNAHVAHFRPATGPGHATMLTGASGNISGIIDNEWFDRTLGERVNCVEDRSARLIGAKQPDRRKWRSPRNLKVSTVGDEIKLATNGRAKVFGISYKDRGAMLPAGRTANAAYWFDQKTGNFISSHYYMAALPDWAVRFNDRRIPAQFRGRQWKKSYPQSISRLAREDNFAHEVDFNGSGITFPHPLTGGENATSEDFHKLFTHTPFADSHLAQFAKTLVANEALGQDEVTDILTVSFSATDRVGHQYGPFSQEQLDNILRLDLLLADFLRFLDQKVGLDRSLILLTSDHGSSAVPEYAAGLGMRAGRIDTSKIPGGQDSVLIPATAEAAMDAEFGEGDWVQAFVKPGIYFNQETLLTSGVDMAEAEAAVRRALLQVAGIRSVFSSRQIETNALPDDKITRMVVKQFDPLRSGDLIVVNEVNFVTSAYKHSQTSGADHETCFDYDTHIPLILFGQPFKAGAYRFRVSLNDLAPTVASVLGLASPSGNQGRVLHEALSRTSRNQKSNH